MSRATSTIDCAIIGGGPAGLTAALYAARYRLSVLVLDAGEARASLIPCTRNQAGFPDGVSGRELMGRMRAHAELYGARLVTERAVRLETAGETWSIATTGEAHQARAVILATGVVNRRPAMDEATHAEALARGAIRYCPVCDGFEVTDRRVAVVGDSRHGPREAIFLRAYTADVTLVTTDPAGVGEADRARLEEAGVTVLYGPPRDFRLEPEGLSFVCEDERLTFESVYPALGSDTRSELAASVGARLTEEGCILTDAHQRTSIPGLYAAGDVVLGLDQISHAMGQAGVAATALRNDLAARTPLRAPLRQAARSE